MVNDKLIFILYKKNLYRAITFAQFMSISSSKLLATLGVALFALFALPALAGEKGSLEKVSLQLSWDHQFTSAGF